MVWLVVSYALARGVWDGLLRAAGLRRGRLAEVEAIRALQEELNVLREQRRAAAESYFPRVGVMQRAPVPGVVWLEARR